MRVKRIYLVGFMGAGKSTVGRRLARRLGWRFIDLDEAVERRAGRTVAEIFADAGESEFRRREAETLRHLDDVEAAVVATGGGAVSSAENRRWMRRRGVSVWLDAPLPLLLERLRRGDPAQRPLFVGEEEARELYRRRLADYRDADLRVAVDASQSASAVTEAVVLALRERGCAI